MKHRHLVDDVGFTPAAIDDILDRGKPQDWIELRDAILEDPFGGIAETVVNLCLAHDMYGTSKLWPAFVQSAQCKHVVKKEPSRGR